MWLRASGFGPGLPVAPAPDWTFDGTPAPMSGGALLDFSAATETSDIAAVSTNGTVATLVPDRILRFRTTGPLFQQMNSMIDGSPIDRSLGLPFSRPTEPAWPAFFPAPGQHLHSLFSHLNGESVGEVLRVGVGGWTVDVPSVCWTEDDEYVIYFQQIPGTLRFDKLCVVDASR